MPDSSESPEGPRREAASEASFAWRMASWVAPMGVDDGDHPERWTSGRPSTGAARGSIMTAMLQWLVGFAPRWHYLAALIVCLVCTAPLEWVVGARVYRRPRAAAIAIVAGAAPFVVWDFLAILAENWHFSARHTIGWMVGVFPIEELGFFVVIPLCALLTYEAVGLMMGRRVRRVSRPDPD